LKRLGTLVEVERSGTLRSVKTFLFAVAAAVLVGAIVLIELPHQGDGAQTKHLTGRDLLSAYERIQPGITRASQLARLGLDTAAADTQVLSYLGVIERFMPHDTVAFDRLDGGVRDCFDARDRCTALVFRAPDPAKATATGHGFLSTFGLGAAAAANTPRVTLLIRNGRVAFKMMSGVAAMTGVRSARVQTRSTSIGPLPIPVRLSE
jgi:hypothetical protein